MKKIYTLPELEKIVCHEKDILTWSFILDETNRENVANGDPWAPQSAEIAIGHQEG